MEEREPTREQLAAKIRTLEERLWEAEQTIEAIQSGDVDALVIHKPDGEQIYTLTGADHGYRVLVESVSEGALILSSDDSIYYCNRTLGEILQLPIQKIIGSTLDSYIAAEARPRLMELIKESLSFGAAWGESLMKRNDETLLPVNVSLNRMSVEDFEGVCAIITDLSEQKQVEEELRRHRTELEFQVNERTAELAAARTEAISEKNRLEAVMEALPIGVAITDLAGGSLQSNVAYEQIWGSPRPPAYSVDDYAAYKAWWADTGRLVAPEEWASARAVKCGEPIIGQLMEIERFDGSHAFVINSACPVRDAQGSVIACAVAIQDITDLRKAEQALRESEERFRLFMDNSPTIAWMKDAEGRHVYLNKTYENRFGVSLAGWLGKTDLEVCPGETAEGFRKNDQAVLAAGHAIEVMEETVNSDGNLCYWLNSKFPFRDHSGKQYVAGLGLDITERKRAEDLLRDLLHRFYTVLSSLYAGVLLVTEEGVVEFANQSFCELFNLECSPEELKGLSPSEMIERIQGVYADPAGAVKRIQEILDRGLPVKGEEVALRDGRTCLRDFVPLEVEGRRFGRLWHHQNISDRKQMENALRESEARFKLLSETAGRLLASEHPQGIVDELFRDVMELLDCHAFFNFLMDETAGKLHLNAWAGIPEEEAQKIEWLDYGVAVCGCVARDGARIVAEDIFNTPDVRTELVKSYGIQAYACHPLMVEGRLIGTLSFGTKTRTRFSLMELEVMRTVANQVATAMERMRLLEELQRSRDGLEIQVRKRTAELKSAIEELRVEILERHSAEEAATRARTSLQNVFDGIATPLLMIDRHLSVGMLNKAARKYFNVADDDESVGRCCHDLAFGKDSPCDRCGILLAIREGKESTFERDGLFERERIEQVTVYPLEEAASGVPCAIVRIDDITESKNIEKHLMQADRLSSLGLVAGGIAHEIRNPLQGLNLFVDVLSDEEKFHRTTQELNVFQEMKINIRKIDGIIRRVLDFSKQSVTTSQKLKMSVMIDESLRLWRTRMTKSGITMRLSVAENIREILGDPIEIQQVLTNLVQNAFEAMQRNGTLDIIAENGILSFDKKRPAVLIKVQDSGPGIPLDQQKKIFSPFFTTKQTGTGLGLAISHRIVSRHGGLLSFSSSPGVGTTFTIELPALIES